MQVKQENDLLESNPYLDQLGQGRWCQGIPYEWDDKLDVLAQEEAPSMKMGAIHISNWRCGWGENDAEQWQPQASNRLSQSVIHVVRRTTSSPPAPCSGIQLHHV